MSKVECPNCQRLLKQLNVQKADFQFEIKKIQEDKSTEKAMYEIHLQKELRRWQQNYHKQQSLREDEARNWLNKHDATVSNYEARISSLTDHHSTILNNKILELTTKSQTKYSTTVDNYENQIYTLTKAHQQMLDKLVKSHSQENTILNIAHQETVTTLKSNHKTTLEDISRRHDSKILGLESEKNKQCELHKKTKEESQKMQTKLYQEIFGFKRKILELQNKIETLEKDILDRKSIIINLNEKIVSVNEENARNIDNLAAENSQQLEETKQNYQNKIRSVYEDALKYCNQYKDSIAKIDETRKNQKEQYLNNLEQIQQSMENRVSRSEDLEEMEFLRAALSKKTKECDMMNEELKWYRLELENKEETYNKIFVSVNGSSNQNMPGKRKQFKLRRQGRSVTTVRQILQSINSGTLEKKNTPIIPKPKVL